MKQRIVYIDNLKALAIFTVVIGHVFWFTWNHYTDSIWFHLIEAYNMPLFFFLSGMFAKDDMNLEQLGRKVKHLLLPTIIVGGIYAYIHEGLWEILFGRMHFGYWFLPALFQMFVLFYFRSFILSFLRKKLNIGRKMTISFDVVYMFGCWGLAKKMTDYVPEDIYNMLCLGHIAENALFFWSGFLVWQNKEMIVKYLGRYKDMIYAICFLLFAGIFYLCFYSGYEIPGIVVRIMALLSIVLLMIFFQKYSFGNGKIQKAISYVGSHSLEIYLLQYFFLPTNYQLENSVIGGVNCLCISLIESMITVVLCVVVIKIIDINKYLNLLFFGK